MRATIIPEYGSPPPTAERAESEAVVGQAVVHCSPRPSTPPTSRSRPGASPLAARRSYNETTLDPIAGAWSGQAASRDAGLVLVA